VLDAGGLMTDVWILLCALKRFAKEWMLDTEEQFSVTGVSTLHSHPHFQLSLKEQSTF
jgi:hypothetical protein